MDEFNLDAMIISSRHNIQSVLGRYRFNFFSAKDAIGTCRYLLPIFCIKGVPDHSTYIGSSMESGEQSIGEFWMPNILNRCWVTQGANAQAIQLISDCGKTVRRTGMEMDFLLADAFLLLRSAFERVVDSMLKVFGTYEAGTSKMEQVDALRPADMRRGLSFDYERPCNTLIAVSSNSRTQWW